MSKQLKCNKWKKKLLNIKIFKKRSLFGYYENYLLILVLDLRYRTYRKNNWIFSYYMHIILKSDS